MHDRVDGTAKGHHDVRDLVSLVGHHLDRTVLGTVEGLHRAVAGRVFDAVPGSAPVRAVHDAVAVGVYGTVRVGLRAGTRLGAAAADVATRGREVRWFEATPGRGRTLEIVHGIVGDRLATTQPSLDLPLRLRDAGRDVAVDGPTLAATYPDAGPRVAVFLHGLTESERSWDAPGRSRRRPAETVARGAEHVLASPEVDTVVDAAADGDGASDDVAVLPDVVADLGWTPVRVRYGTGRAIEDNGAALAELLTDLVAAWPVPVTELALIGHSMGGLVLRSACRIGAAADLGWVPRVSHTVTLGTPHLGSWLERAAEAGVRHLRTFPEGEVVARVIDTRARGIKDLHHGPDRDAPLLGRATHHLVAGRLTRSPRHPVTRVFGDLLVTPDSALGRDADRPLVGGRIERLELASGHFRLLHDPAVADHLRRHLA